MTFVAESEVHKDSLAGRMLSLLDYQEAGRVKQTRLNEKNEELQHGFAKKLWI